MILQIWWGALFTLLQFTFYTLGVLNLQFNDFNMLWMFKKSYPQDWYVTKYYICMIIIEIECKLFVQLNKDVTFRYILIV